MPAGQRPARVSGKGRREKGVTMWLLALASLAAAVGYVLVVRRPAQRRATEARVDPRQSNLLGIAVPRGQVCCAAALRLQGHRFKANAAPNLPLAECTQAEACRCGYQALPERRIAVRRREGERRARLRFDPDNPPRRLGPGRRKEDWLGWAVLPFGNRRRAQVSDKDSLHALRTVSAAQKPNDVRDEGREDV